MLDELLKNPFFQLAGWILGVISSIITIFQLIEKKKLAHKVAEKETIIVQLQSQIGQLSVSNGDRKIAQGAKSQYIETATAPINIKLGK
jgi:hypothetical protein